MRRDAGFSLLELLVVLAMISFMTALVAPRLKNTVDAIGRSGDRAEAIRQLERLPLLARSQGQAIAVAKDQPLAAPLVALPQGWSMQVLDQLQVADNGFCSPATVAVTEPGGNTENWALAVPDCRVGDAP